MKTVLELYVAMRERFPELASRADKLHVRRWDELNSDLAHIWFESLAQTINADMTADRPFQDHAALFACLASAFDSGSEAVKSCIGVSFVENLFWEVPPGKAQGYWLSLPQRLKDFYIAFHQRGPL